MEVETVKTGKMGKKTLRELGNILPIGIDTNKIKSFVPRDDSFKFKEWGFEQEEEIAKFKKDEASSGRFASSVMSMMLDELGGQKWDKIGEVKELIMNQMDMADVMYMYIYLRIEALGEEFAFSNLTCPSCGHIHEEFVVDLRDIDVDYVPKDKDGKVIDVEPIIEYKLKKPIKYSHVGADGNKVEEIIETFKISRSSWSIMEQITHEAAENEAITKKLIIMGSIAGYNDTEGYVPDEMISSLKKIDYERLDKLIAKHNGGPTIVIVDNCKKCNKKFAQQINWSYDYFFGSSSLPSM